MVAGDIYILIFNRERDYFERNTIFRVRLLWMRIEHDFSIENPAFSAISSSCNVWGESMQAFPFGFSVLKIDVAAF